MTKTRKTITAGRPPKFDEPSRPVTVTLPHRILRRLEELDADRGKAIVKCVEAVAGAVLGDEKRVEVVAVSEGAGMIVIGPCRCLAKIPWLRLIEIAPARFILSIPTGTGAASLEVAILDLLEHLTADEVHEKHMLEELRRLLSHHRRQQEVTRGEILFVDI